MVIEMFDAKKVKNEKITRSKSLIPENQEPMGDLCVFHRCPLPRRQNILHVLRFAAQAPNAIKNTEILSDFRAFLEASPRLELGNKDFADGLADAQWIS